MTGIALAKYLSTYPRYIIPCKGNHHIEGQKVCYLGPFENFNHKHDIIKKHISSFCW